MYDGIRSWGGIGEAGAILPILYFIFLVVVGNCILYGISCSKNHMITNQPMTVSITCSGNLNCIGIVACETGAILCQIALWDSFGQETGSKFDTTSSRSHA